MDAWGEIAAIALIALAAGVVHSAIGFGYGIVALTLVALVIDVRAAHVVVSVSSVPMLLMAAWAYRKGFERRSLLEAALGAVLFLPLGFYLFETVALHWLVRGTGLAIFLMVVWSLRDQGVLQNESSRKGSCFAAGAAAGFLGGAVSIAGPPIAAFALKQNWSQLRYKSFVTQCLLIIATYKAVILSARNFLVGDIVPQAAVAAVAAIIGVQLGVLLSSRIPAAGFKWLLAIALFSVAFWMMWSG